MEDITTYIQTLDATYIYILLFVIAYLENIVPPIPGDLPVVFVGSLIPSLNLDTFMCIMSASVGSLLGYMTMFLIGKFIAKKIYKKSRSDSWLGKMFLTMFSPKNLTSVSASFKRYGYGLIAINRFLTGTRALISIFSGLAQLNFLYVHIAAMCSAIVWNIILIYGGLALGTGWTALSDQLSYIGIIITIIAIIVLVVIAMNFKKKKKKQPKQPSATSTTSENI